MLICTAIPGPSQEQMKLPFLFRRRSLLVPTLPGILLIFLALGFPLYFLFQNAATFLAVNQPIGAEYLVIEGWLGKNELNQANRVFDEQNYQYAIVTGGPITDDFNTGPATYAERATTYLLSIGFPQDKLFEVPTPYSAQERTFFSAVMVRDWFTEQRLDIRSLDVFSGDVHSRRSRNLYQLAFGNQVNIGIYASKPNEFDLSRWWQSSDAAKAVASELIGWGLVKCCFKPGERGSHFEKWGIEK